MSFLLTCCVCVCGPPSTVRTYAPDAVISVIIISVSCSPAALPLASLCVCLSLSLSLYLLAVWHAVVMAVVEEKLFFCFPCRAASRSLFISLFVLLLLSHSPFLLSMFGEEAYLRCSGLDSLQQRLRLNSLFPSLSLFVSLPSRFLLPLARPLFFPSRHLAFHMRTATHRGAVAVTWRCAAATKKKTPFLSLFLFLSLCFCVLFVSLLAKQRASSIFPLFAIWQPCTCSPVPKYSLSVVVVFLLYVL